MYAPLTVQLVKHIARHDKGHRLRPAIHRGRGFYRDVSHCQQVSMPHVPGHSTTFETRLSTLKKGDNLKRMRGIGAGGAAAEEDDPAAGVD